MCYILVDWKGRGWRYCGYLRASRSFSSRGHGFEQQNWHLSPWSDSFLDTRKVSSVSRFNAPPAISRRVLQKRVCVATTKWAMSWFTRKDVDTFFRWSPNLSKNCRASMAFLARLSFLHALVFDGVLCCSSWRHNWLTDWSHSDVVVYIYGDYRVWTFKNRAFSRVSLFT